MRDVMMIVDLQFGSTGKGQVAGTYGRLWGADTVVCANGPNAGHTYRWTENGVVRKIVHTVLPVGSILPTVRNILLGPGAVVDPAKLAIEINNNLDLLRGKRLIIHPNAAIVMEYHRNAERTLINIGSTMKGTSEAMIEKIHRGSAASIARHHGVLHYNRRGLTEHKISGLETIVDYAEYDQAIDSSVRLLVEGAQGASLSIHSHFYPYTTSRDVSINQIWADCRLPGITTSRYHEANIQIIGVCRTYPIRVASRYDDRGNKIGYSGDCYDDQREIPWSDIEREPELTTVTKLPRRLFTFSTKQIMEAARFNGPTSIALTFCDYMGDVAGRNLPEGMMPWVGGLDKPIAPDVLFLVRRIESAAECRVHSLSYGPNDTDMYGFRHDEKTLIPLSLPSGSR